MMSSKRATSKEDILALERDVLESTRARLDVRRVNEVFLEEEYPESVRLDQWKVALAAGTVAFLGANAMVNSFTVSSVICVAVFIVANGDPMEEDSVAGALARVVGRFTLQSVEASRPKVRAIARAAVRGEDEVAYLRAQIADLEEENNDLWVWKQQREAVDANLSDFNAEELKQLARDNRITIGGTKSQLLMRLVEAGIVDL